MPKYLQVFFSKEEKKELARLAVELDTNMTAIVRQAVKDFLAKHSATQQNEKLEDRLSSIVVWKATNNGQSCYFGNEGQATAYARSRGTMERIELQPLPELSIVE